MFERTHPAGLEAHAELPLQVFDPGEPGGEGRGRRPHQEAANPDGLIPRTVALLKSHFPELGVLTDVALDPYTSHGQDGLIDEDGQLLNEPTVAMLVRQALTQLESRK